MTSGLRRFRQPVERPSLQERCEMCAEPVTEEHSHVVNVESRAIMCTCRACYLLFTREGAVTGKHRAVPDRYLHAPSFPVGQQLWDSIGIPVRMAFFFTNSALDTTTAFYPSPAGATESLLPMDTWSELIRENPDFTGLAPDVEALLVNKRGDEFECFLVPIDRCYELVGLVRMHWRGFDGGTEAWQHIDGFFAELRARSELVA